MFLFRNVTSVLPTVLLENVQDVRSKSVEKKKDRRSLSCPAKCSRIALQIKLNDIHVVFFLLTAHLVSAMGSFLLLCMPGTVSTTRYFRQ